MPEASNIPKQKTLLNIAEKAFRKVFKNKNYSLKDLFDKEEYQALAKQTIDIYKSAFPDNITDEMRIYLEEDVFVFSQLKTHTQLAEARALLKDEKGNLREWSSFKEEILKLNNTYNKNYLQSEYVFAIQSSLSASQWARWNDDTKNYWLEYQTMGDELVRDSHQALNGIKLPKNDPFWEQFYPPNGWRCRCDVLETRAEDKPPVSSKKAIAKGMNATDQTNGNGVNKLAMFRFNPGMQKKVFPPNNSYIPKYCGTSKKPQGLLPFASLEDERCKALEEIEKRAKIKFEKNKILASPRDEQFKEISKNVFEHILTKKKDDYTELVELAKIFSKNKKKTEILPEIDAKNRSARRTVFPNYKKSLRTNPDLRHNNTYYDLKRPKVIKNILGNANKASKQGCIAVISDSRLDKTLTNKIMYNRAQHIFKSKEYTKNIVIFKRNNKLITFKRSQFE